MHAQTTKSQKTSSPEPPPNLPANVLTPPSHYLITLVYVQQVLSNKELELVLLVLLVVFSSVLHVLHYLVVLNVTLLLFFPIKLVHVLVDLLYPVELVINVVELNFVMFVVRPIFVANA